MKVTTHEHWPRIVVDEGDGRQHGRCGDDDLQVIWDAEQDAFVEMDSRDPLYEPTLSELVQESSRG